MDLDFEERILFNGAFGASILWQFSRSFFDAREQREGPDLPLLHLVLPLAYHRRSAEALKGLFLDGGLLRAFGRVPDLHADMSMRAEEFADCTRASLNLACASGLLRVEKSDTWPSFVPGCKTLPGPLRPAKDSLRAILATAKRLGHWTAQEQRQTLWRYFDIRF